MENGTQNVNNVIGTLLQVEIFRENWRPFAPTPRSPVSVIHCREEDNVGGTIVRMPKSHKRHTHRDMDDGIDCTPCCSRFCWFIQDCPCCGENLWFVRDICGVICAVMTYGLVVFATFVVTSVMIVPTYNSHPAYCCINSVIFFMCAFLAVVSHVKAMLTDPVRTNSNEKLHPTEYGGPRDGAFT